MSIAVVVVGAHIPHAPGSDLVQTSTYNPTVMGLPSGTTQTLKVERPSGSTSTGAVVLADSSASGNAATIAMDAFVANLPNNHLGTFFVGKRNGADYYRVMSTGSITRLSGVDMTIGGKTSVPVDGDFNTAGMVIHWGGVPWVRRNTGSSNLNIHPVGFSSVPSTKTANYTLVYSDTTVIYNGTALTATLPDPTTSGITGREFTIKNIHSAALSVVSAGTSKTIDGAASVSLSQWDKITVLSDGTQWLITEGRKQVSVSTTAPTAPQNGDVWFDIS